MNYFAASCKLGFGLRELHTWLAIPFLIEQERTFRSQMLRAQTDLGAAELECAAFAEKQRLNKFKEQRAREPPSPLPSAPPTPKRGRTPSKERADVVVPSAAADTLRVTRAPSAPASPAIKKTKPARAATQAVAVASAPIVVADSTGDALDFAPDAGISDAFFDDGDAAPVADVKKPTGLFARLKGAPKPAASTAVAPSEEVVRRLQALEAAEAAADAEDGPQVGVAAGFGGFDDDGLGDTPESTDSEDEEVAAAATTAATVTVAAAAKAVAAHTASDDFYGSGPVVAAPRAAPVAQGSGIVRGGFAHDEDDELGATPPESDDESD